MSYVFAASPKMLRVMLLSGSVPRLSSTFTESALLEDVSRQISTRSSLNELPDSHQVSTLMLRHLCQ